ncbi:MFS transporter [Chitinimonas koreensis]|uniref:MFS transporter n=1 Tax=Chitinimonas koreensis TaxID=356302 RepID=UPI00223FB8F5|nr:MFS transporter [Chitinimonas koreensis]
MLGAPLAMVAMPIYILAPDYFTRGLGLPLAGIGAVLFATRLFDALLDPWLGSRFDRYRARGVHREALAIAALILAVVFAALWQPPASLSDPARLGWVAACLFLSCAAHGAINLAYLSWGARLSDSRRLQLEASALRELAGLAGVCAASLLPAWLRQAGSPAEGMLGFSICFALCLFVGMAALLRHAPPWQPAARAPDLAWWQLAADEAVRPLLLPYALNAVAVALPSTLVLFFVADQLASPAWAGASLALYFLAAAAGLPAWQRIAAAIGPLRAWRGGMLLSVACFAWASCLGEGEAGAFAVVCLLSGLALGADLCLPAVLLARRLRPELPLTAAYGVLQAVGKLALASTGLALPLLALLGYQPGARGHWALAACYAGLPCLLKLGAWASSSRLREAFPQCRTGVST